MPVTQINYTPWNGIGRSIYEEVIFENAGVGYVLWVSFDKDPEAEQPFSGGILVMHENGNELASLKCEPVSIVAGIDALFEVMESHGQCWSYDKFIWQDCQ